VDRNLIKSDTFFSQYSVAKNIDRKFAPTEGISIAQTAALNSATLILEFVDPPKSKILVLTMWHAIVTALKNLVKRHWT
jgi:hypothetical protein